MFGTLFLDCDSVITIYNHYVSLKKKNSASVGHRWWVRVKRVVPRERDGVDVVLVRRDQDASLDEAEGFEVILQEVVTGSGVGWG